MVMAFECFDALISPHSAPLAGELALLGRSSPTALITLTQDSAPALPGWASEGGSAIPRLSTPSGWHLASGGRCLTVGEE